MSDTTVLVVGGTGRTGSRVIRQLLDRGVRVKAIVRSAGRIPADLAENDGLTVIQADLLSLSREELASHVRGCGAVVSCLGHNLSLAGVFGAPRDLVEEAVVRLCSAIQAAGAEPPTKLILMSSVSVNHPGGTDTRRGTAEKACLALLRGVLPPARDNQRAADYLWAEIGRSNGRVEWVAVRPDTLLEGDVCEYAVHDGLIDSLFAPGQTNMDNVADFMCALATDDETWGQWRGSLPVVVNAAQA